MTANVKNDCTCDLASCDTCWTRLADRMWPDDAPHSIDPAGWGVFVDEVGINACRAGRDWWAAFAIRFGTSERITVLDICIAGIHGHVACDSKADAEQLRQQMLDNGVHPKCVAVRTLEACRRTMRVRHAARYDHEDGCEYCVVPQEAVSR